MIFHVPAKFIVVLFVLIIGLTLTGIFISQFFISNQLHGDGELRNDIDKSDLYSTLFRNEIIGNFSIPDQLKNTRNGNLTTLVSILNSFDAWNIFKNWQNTHNDIDRFLSLLDPWLVKADLAVDLKVIVRPKIILNCNQRRYSSVLMGDMIGTESNTSNILIDFIMLGYDIEKLLIRLFELYNDVDLFVIYETPYTLIGTRKRIYYDEIIKQDRFLQFLDKIIYINGDSKEMRDVVNITKLAFRMGEKSFSKVTFIVLSYH